MNPSTRNYFRRSWLGRWSRLLALAGAALVASGCGYSRIQELEEQAATARSEMEVQLQRRSEIVPTLLETIESYERLEAGLIDGVADAWAELVPEVRSKNLGRMQAANSRLQDALEALLELARRDATIESDPSYRILSSQLDTAQTRFREARGAYNEAVRRYNSFIAEFPQMVTAKVIGAARLEPLETEPAEPQPNSETGEDGPD